MGLLRHRGTLETPGVCSGSTRMMRVRFGEYIGVMLMSM